MSNKIQPHIEEFLTPQEQEEEINTQVDKILTVIENYYKESEDKLGSSNIWAVVIQALEVVVAVYITENLESPSAQEFALGKFIHETRQAMSAIKNEVNQSVH